MDSHLGEKCEIRQFNITKLSWKAQRKGDFVGLAGCIWIPALPMKYIWVTLMRT